MFARSARVIEPFTLALMLALAGCGSLAGKDYKGEPLFQIEGVVQSDAAMQLRGEVGVALLWANDTAVELSTQAVVVETQFPARYTLKIYQAPPEASKLRVAGGQVLEASVGQILLFEDLDGSGTWDTETEPLIGGAYNAAVLFVPGSDLPYVPDQAEPAVAPPSGTDDDPDFDPEDPEDPRVTEPPGPLWTPTGGFHLIEVAPGPFCQLPWEAWMQRADETAATLHIGYYGNVGSDWDCDGNPDFDDSIESGSNDAAGAPDNFGPDGEPCPPEDILTMECMGILEEIGQLGGLPPDEAQDVLGYLLGWVADYPQCIEEYCPEVAAAVEELGGGQAGPF